MSIINGKELEWTGRFTGEELVNDMKHRGTISELYYLADINGDIVPIKINKEYIDYSEKYDEYVTGDIGVSYIKDHTEIDRIGLDLVDINITPATFIGAFPGVDVRDALLESHDKEYTIYQKVGLGDFEKITADEIKLNQKVYAYVKDNNMFLLTADINHPKDRTKDGLRYLGDYSGRDLLSFWRQCNSPMFTMSTGHSFNIEKMDHDKMYSLYENGEHVLCVFDNSGEKEKKPEPDQESYGKDEPIFHTINGDIHTGAQWKKFAIDNIENSIEAFYLFHQYFSDKASNKDVIIESKKYRLFIKTTGGAYVSLIDIDTEKDFQHFDNPENKIVIGGEYYIPFDIKESHPFSYLRDWMVYCNKKYTRSDSDEEKQKYLIGYALFLRFEKEFGSFKPNRYYFIEIRDLEELMLSKDKKEKSVNNLFAIKSDDEKNNVTKGTITATVSKKKTITYSEDTVSEYMCRVGLDDDFREALHGLFDYLSEN